MNDTVKRDNRKALPKYLLVLLVSAAAGGLMGFLTGWYGHSDLSAAFADSAESLLRLIAPWGIPVCTLVLLGGGYLLYRSAKRDFAAWDGEDDTLMDALDQRLNWCLLLNTLMLLTGFFFLSTAVVGLFRPGDPTPLYIAISFLLSMFLGIVFQQRIVDLVRRMNPEKQGSIYDLRFQKKWLESCDEAERREMGEAAYQAFRAVNIACPILWLALLLMGMVFRLGMLPCAAVLLVWGILQVSYILTCIRIRCRSVGSSISL